MASSDSAEETEATEDIFGDELTFDSITRDTIRLDFYDDADFIHHNATRRTYRRQDFDANTRPRYDFDIEMFAYLKFHVMAYLLSILRTSSFRLMIWISAG